LSAASSRTDRRSTFMGFGAQEASANNNPEQTASLLMVHMVTQECACPDCSASSSLAFIRSRAVTRKQLPRERHAARPFSAPPCPKKKRQRPPQRVCAFAQVTLDISKRTAAEATQVGRCWLCASARNFKAFLPRRSRGAAARLERPRQHQTRKRRTQLSQGRRTGATRHYSMLFARISACGLIITRNRGNMTITWLEVIRAYKYTEDLCCECCFRDGWVQWLG